MRFRVQPVLLVVLSSGPTIALQRGLIRLEHARCIRRSAAPLLATAGDDDSTLGEEEQSLLSLSLKKRMEQLDQEQRELGKALDTRWRSAKCKSAVVLSVDDWVRRLALAEWPLVAVGTASGSVCVANLNSGRRIASASGVHPAYLEGTEDDMRLLHGEYDGGGLTALAFRGDRILSAGREGGARMWRLGTAPKVAFELGQCIVHRKYGYRGAIVGWDLECVQSDSWIEQMGVDCLSRGRAQPFYHVIVDESDRPDGQVTYVAEENVQLDQPATELTHPAVAKLFDGFGDGRFVPSAKLRSRFVAPRPLHPGASLRDDGMGIVSSIAMLDENDEGVTVAWTASLDGVLRCWRLSAALEAQCTVRVDTSSPVLCVAADERAGVLACGRADGVVSLFALADGTLLGSWDAFAPDSSKGYRGSAARSVEMLHVGSSACCVVAGANDGTARFRWLCTDRLRERRPGVSVFDEERPTCALLPAHNGALVALRAVRDREGLLVSGAHDGTLRIWDLMPAADGDAPRCLYGLGGYKVWLGSVCTDGQRLISDGSDNSVVSHDFLAEDEQDTTNS